MFFQSAWILRLAAKENIGLMFPSFLPLSLPFYSPILNRVMMDLLHVCIGLVAEGEGNVSYKYMFDCSRRIILDNIHAEVKAMATL